MEARGVWKIETEGGSILATEEAAFSVGRESSVRRIKRVRLEDSIESEKNRTTCKIGKTQFIRQSNAIPKLKAIWAFLKVYSLVAHLVQNPPAILETWVQSLTWKDPLEKGKATHSSILT